MVVKLRTLVPWEEPLFGYQSLKVEDFVPNIWEMNPGFLSDSGAQPPTSHLTSGVWVCILAMYTLHYHELYAQSRCDQALVSPKNSGFHCYCVQSQLCGVL